MQRLLMFTEAYPYSKTESWKGFELDVLRERFDEVVVAPLRRAWPDMARVPPGVDVLAPVFEASEPAISRASRLTWAARRAIRHLRFQDAGLSPTRLRTFLAAAQTVDAILECETFRRNIIRLLPGSKLYFYWARGYAELIPYLTRSCQAASLVRLHGYDLYAERNGGYIPYQSKILRAVGAAGSVSRHGQRYLTDKFPALASKIDYMPLGTKLGGVSTASSDGILRIVSCSYVIPLKRVPLIAEALKLVQSRVEWQHIGAGPGFAALQQMISALPPHVSAKLAGHLMPADVLGLYASGSFDLFLNVSETEGVPVSIMEAMAAEIPVLATNVGGTSELVDEQVGGLLEADFAPAELAKRIDWIAGLGQSARAKMRKLCRERIAERYDIRRNTERVAECLLKLPVCAGSHP